MGHQITLQSSWNSCLSGHQGTGCSGWRIPGACPEFPAETAGLSGEASRCLGAGFLTQCRGTGADAVLSGVGCDTRCLSNATWTNAGVKNRSNRRQRIRLTHLQDSQGNRPMKPFHETAGDLRRGPRAFVARGRWWACVWHAGLPPHRLESHTARPDQKADRFTWRWTAARPMPCARDRSQAGPPHLKFVDYGIMRATFLEPGDRQVLSGGFHRGGARPAAVYARR